MGTGNDAGKGGILLSLVSVFALVCLFDLQAYSLDIMGPPAAELEQGTFDAGIEFTNSKMDIELVNGFVVDFLYGEWLGTDEWHDVTLKDLKINRTYVRFGYGILDDVEIFLRLGGLNARFGDSIWEDSEKFDSGDELAGGAGVKLTFYEEEGFKLGGLFQFSTLSFDGQLKSPYWPASDFVEADMSEVQIAVGASCKCNEHLTVYGGPFLHLAGGSLTDELTELDTDDPDNPGIIRSKFNWDIEQESVLGGYIGAQLNFARNFSFNIEYQQTTDARALGMGLLFKF
jgi:hypothetical protein